MDEQMIDLCPWCGVAPTLEDFGGDKFFVSCSNDECFVQPETGWFKSASDAVAKWNHRAAHSVMAGKVAELTEALQFYARENNWRSSTVYMCGHGDINCNVMGDKGAKARAALAPYPERRHE